MPIFELPFSSSLAICRMQILMFAIRLSCLVKSFNCCLLILRLDVLAIYRGLKDSDVDSFVDDVIVNGKPWAAGVQEIVSGSHIFVCAHGSRDKRCGVCGPVLIEKLKEGIESRGLQEQVFVSACSHIGGHKYAGNLIIYSPDSQGKIMGHW